MNDRIDQQLMEQYIQGEAIAFDELYARHHKRVYAYIVKRLSNREDQDEIFQNTWIKFHRSRQLYRPGTPVLPWLFIICRSELIDYLRRTKKHVAWHDDLLPLLDNQASANENFDLSSFDFLGEREKQALNLRFYEDVDYTALAKMLHTKESNARKIISRGIQKIRHYFGGQEDDHENEN